MHCQIEKDYRGIEQSHVRHETITRFCLALIISFDTPIHTRTTTHWSMCQGRKRNCRLRLLFSMESMSVTTTDPPSPQPRPIKARFLSSSHPIAPAPTTKYFCRDIT